MTLPVTTPSWFDSSEPGAPTMNNAAGSLLNVLRACLIDGFGSVSVTNIVVSSEVATVNATAHGFTNTYGKLVLIEGCSETALNGRKRVVSAATDTFTFAAPGVADGTYTGTISAKRAPLGWAETHTGTNIAIFASASVEATPNSLRVDDSGTASMSRWVGIPTANITNITTYSGEYPSSAQVSGGAYVQKGSANNSTAKPWAIVGDDRGFYLMTQMNTSAGDFQIVHFGDIRPYYAGDTGANFLATQSNTSVSATSAWGLASGAGAASNPSTNSGLYAAKGIGVGETSPAYQGIAVSIGGTSISGSNNFQDAASYPNYVLDESVAVVSTNGAVRGEVPGLTWVVARSSSLSLSGFSVLQSGSKQFLMFLTRSSASTGAHAIRLDDWRR